MNKDFHYYGTYVAARLAGYDFSSAELIAHAAQYVDDSDSSRLKDADGSYYIRDFTPVPTVHTLTELGKHTTDSGWTEEFLDEVYRVWPVFHFLPGNFDETGNYRKEYTGAMSDKGSMALWEYDEEAKEQFKLMCLPNSILVKKMIADLNQYSPLHEIGLRMHTLADTWAHTYYSGIPAWFTNDVSEGGSPWLPNAPYYNSYTYLGHCRTGSSPDYPHKKYNFKVQWCKDAITKDNPADFLLALSQMVEAMSCIRNHRSFDTEKYATIDSANKQVITDILKTNADDQSSTWKSKIHKITINGKALEVPAEYVADKWLNTAKSTSGSISGTDYYKFNVSAVKHLHFVKVALGRERIFLDDIPRERIITCTIKLKEDLYISKLINKLDTESYIPDETMPDKGPANKQYPYASVGTDPVTLKLIYPNDDTLRCGTNIKIRTVETTQENPEYTYLGAWKSDSYLYYYIKDFYLFQQKWCIGQSGAATGDVIDLDKPIVITNKHFTKAPYLQPGSKSSGRLTTRAREYTIDRLIEQASPGYLLLLDNYASTDSDAFVSQAKICHDALMYSLSAREQLAVMACTKYGDHIYPAGEDAQVVTISGNRKETADAAKAIREYTAWRNESNYASTFNLLNQMLAGTEKKYYILFTTGNSTWVGLDPAEYINAGIPLLVHAAYPSANEDKARYASMLALNERSQYFSGSDPSDIMLRCNEIRSLVSETSLLVNQVLELSGSDYQETAFYIAGLTCHMQISIVWSDANYQYTSGDAGKNKIKVYLTEPGGQRYPAMASITGNGFCLFDITDIPMGKWTIYMEYGIPTTAPVQCGIGVHAFISHYNTTK